MEKISDPIRIASIGLNFGAHESRAIKTHPKMKLVTVCDLEQNKADALAEELGTEATTSYESILARDDIEAVALFTPPRFHAEHIKMAAKAGKHIVTTKPFELTARKAAEAVDAAEQAGVVLMSNSPPPRYIDTYGAVKEAIDDGRLGRLVHISGLSWACYADDHMQPDGSWYDDPEACPGGPLYRLGIYIINFATAFLGEPEEVFAQQSWIRSQRPTPDHSTMTVKYKNGAQMNLIASLSVGGGIYPDSMIVAGTNGTLLVNPEFASEGDQEVVYAHRRETQKEKRYTAIGRYDYDGLYEFLRHGEKPTIDIRSAVNGIRIIEAAARSLKEKCSVPVEGV